MTPKPSKPAALFLVCLAALACAPPRLAAQTVDSTSAATLVARVLNSEVGAPEQLDAVRRLVADPDLRGLSLLVRSLGEGVSADIQRRATLALIAMGRTATPGLIEVLQADDPVQRRNAAAILGLVADPRAIPALRAASRDGNANVRDIASSALSVADPTPTTTSDARLAALRAARVQLPIAAERNDASTAPASVEVPAPAAEDPVHLKVGRGTSILVRLTEDAGRNITQVQVVQGTRSVISTAVTGEAGPWLVGSRELKLSASPRAALGFYRIEGLVRGRVRYVLPISLEVTGGALSTFAQLPATTDLLRRRGASPMGRPRLCFSEPINNMTAYRRALTTFTIDPVLATAVAGRSSLEYVRPATVTGSFDFTLMPGDIPPPWIDIVIPEGGKGFVGQTVELRGGDLPCPLYRDAIAITIGNLPLAILESKPNRVRARLPNFSTNGTLRAIRVSDGMEVIAVANYVVAPFEPFSYFEADAPGYSAMNAYLLAMTSQRVYVDVDASETPTDYESRLKQEFNSPDLEVLEVLHDGDFSGLSSNQIADTQGIIMQTGNVLIVALAGTQTTNQTDLVSDVNAFPFPSPSLAFSPVHTGFWNAAQAVYSKIRSHANRAGTRRIWLTGHSLGGAMAELIGLRMQLDPTCTRKPRGIVTFGAPRVGFASLTVPFQGIYDGFFAPASGTTKAWRVIRHGDPVPLLPPPPAWHHGGKLALLKTDGQIEIDNASDAYPPPPISAFFVEHFDYFNKLEARMKDTPTGQAFSSLWPPAKAF